MPRGTNDYTKGSRVSTWTPTAACNLETLEVSIKQGWEGWP